MHRIMARALVSLNSDEALSPCLSTYFMNDSLELATIGVANFLKKWYKYVAYASFCNEIYLKWNGYDNKTKPFQSSLKTISCSYGIEQILVCKLLRGI